MIARGLVFLAVLVLALPVAPLLPCSGRAECPHCLRKQAERAYARNTPAPAPTTSHSCCSTAKTPAGASATASLPTPLLPANDPAGAENCPCALSGHAPAQRPENAPQLLLSVSTTDQALAAPGDAVFALPEHPRFAHTAIRYPPGAYPNLSSTILRI